MADNIIKLKVDSQEYEGKIKRASQGLQELGRNLREAGKTFADADAKQVEFARELGKMQTVSNTAKGKIAEMSAAFVNLKTTYLQMTDAEKQSPIGQAMSKSLEQLKARTISAKNELESLNRELNATGAKATGGGGLKQMLRGVAGQLGISTSMFTGVGAAVAAYKAISGNVSTAMGFEKSMSQLSSLTGKVGKDLEQLKEYAIELGSTSTLTASEVADAFRMIGSQQPQLLESGEALKNVTKYAITLSEAAGIDLATAAQTLSTSINQMGGDSNNAARYINVLAAASQKGAGDIAWLGEAVTKSGTTAKAVGTDYEELVANLEQLAKAGFDASTAGTALRSIIMNLEKQANNDFKPSIVGLTQAFENLGKANISITGYQEIAGKMFASQAKALADAAGEAKNMTAAITGTNTAEEQAKTNTDNLDGSLKSLASAWEGLNLHINSSNGFLRDCVDWLKDLVVWADKAFTEAGKLKGVLSGLNGEEGSGNTKVDQQLKKLKVIKAGGGSDYIFNATLGGMVEDYNRQIMAIDAQVKNGGKPVGGGSGSSQDIRYLQRQMEALKIMRDQLQSGAKDVLNPVAAISSAITGGDKSGKGGSTKAKVPTIADFEKFIGKATIGADSLKGSDDANFLSPYAMMLDEIKEKILDVKDADLGSALKIPDVYKQKMDEYAKGVAALKTSISTTASLVGTIGQAFGAIEDPAAKVASIVAQAIANIALAYSDALAKDTTSKFNIFGFIAASAASMVSMATAIAQVHSATGYANGGIVKGNSYSGDNMMFGGDGLYGLNAGELVLTKAQQSNLANSLQSNGGNTIRVVGKIAGKDLFICAENWAKSVGKGEFVTW